MNETKKLTIFGDSIAVGQGMTITKNWVHSIAAKYPEWIVTNASQNGRTTRQALEVMQYEIQGHMPDILMVVYGLNDSNFWISDKGYPRVSLNGFKSNIVEIFEKAKTWGINEIIFLNNHPTQKGFIDNQYDYDSNSKLYSLSIIEVMEKFPESSVIDTWRLIDGEKLKDCSPNYSHLMPDGVHLNQRGHELYTKFVLDFFSQKTW